jgi:hypothetical protein
VGFDAPVVGFDAPVVGFDAPVVGFDAPVVGFDAPVVSFDAPVVGFDAPVVGFDAPVVGFDAPVVGFDAAELGKKIKSFLPSLGVVVVVVDVVVDVDGVVDGDVNGDEVTAEGGQSALAGKRFVHVAVAVNVNVDVDVNVNVVPRASPILFHEYAKTFPMGYRPIRPPARGGCFEGTLTMSHPGRTTAVSGPPKTQPVSMPTAWGVTRGRSKTVWPKITRSGPLQWFVQNVWVAGAFDGQKLFRSGGRTHWAWRR